MYLAGNVFLLLCFVLYVLEMECEYFCLFTAWNSQTKKQRNRNKHRCACSVPWRRQRALLPPLSLQTDKSPAQRLSSRCLSPRPPPDAELHTDTAPCSLSASSNFFFFSLDTATSEKLRVWMKRAPPAVCFSWLDSEKRKKNNTNKWVGSERPGESQHRDYMNNLCVTWHEDNNAVVLITPAGGEVSITVIRTRKAAWVFVFLRWTGACWICMFGLNAGYVLSVALVGSQHSSKWHWRGIREQRWKYISEKKHSGADTTRPFTLFKSLKCVSVRPMSKKGVIIVVINSGAD